MIEQAARRVDGHVSGESSSATIAAKPRPSLRRDLSRLPQYVPGRVVPGGGYKLSSNELPEPPDQAVTTAIGTAADGVNRYPGLFADRLGARLAEHLQVPQDRIVTGAGSIAVLQQLLQAAVEPGRPVVFAWRSYEAYPILVRVCHARSVAVPLHEERHDLDTMAAEVVRTDAAMVLVCNPNNPTGTTVDGPALERFLDRVPPDCLVVLDEAYHEFVTDPAVPDGVRLAEGRENVVVLRTFSKAHGLAGLRVGYAICPPRVAAAIRAVALPFTVSSVAEAAAVAALDAWPRQREVVAGLVARRDAFSARLRAAGIEVPTSHANFVWLPQWQVPAAFTAELADRRVTVREFPGDGVRITIGEAAGLDEVCDVLRILAS